MLNALITAGTRLAESGRVPDPLIRAGMRQAISGRASSLDRGETSRQVAVIDSLGTGPITELPEMANHQHYEVPAALFELMLGPRLKYSSCLWDESTDSLAAAEEAMLHLTARRAGLEDGQRVLELGCGWGSLTLWTAERFPNSHITAVTNSTGQAAFINARAAARGLTGIHVEVADVARFSTESRFDRLVSVEMLEHVRNYRELFARMAGWLEQDGRAFVHVFAHATTPYLYEDRGPADWMAREFFSGGVMPSHSLFSHFEEDLSVDASWRLSGLHYHKTLEAWLERLDNHRDAAGQIMRGAGDPHSARTVQRWRMFLMACSELFKYRSGDLWGVSHYVLRPGPNG
jgi:cyclopropane-fatty-acyl-phospholipid synthase